jgi:toxin ParE1/3/4
VVTINFTHKSLDDIDHIGEYHSNYSKSFAKRLIQGFFDTAQLLITFPLMGRVLEEIGETEVREILYHNYRIIYHIFDDENIDIITIQHTSKDLKRHLPNFD